MPEFITAAALRELAAAGSIREVHLVPEADGFLFVTKIGMIERTLRPAEDSRRPRRFKTLDAGARFARELGLTRLEVELANWQPKTKRRA